MSPRDQFGGAQIGFVRQYENLKLDEEKPTPAFRIFPAMHSLAQKAIWAVYHRQHFGYAGVNRKDPTKSVVKPFSCIEEKNNQTGMIEVSCPECRLQDRWEKMRSDREDVLTNEYKKEGLLDEKSIKARMKTDKEYEKILAWQKAHNTGSKWYINVVLEDNTLAVLQLPHKAKQALDARIKKLRDNLIEPITNFDGGVYFVCKRNGSWSNATFEAEVVEIPGSEPGSTKKKMAPLSDEVLEKALKCLPDLSEVVTKISIDQIRLLVDGDGSPEFVDNVFAMSKPKTRPQGQEQQQTSLPPAMTASAPAAAAPAPQAQPPLPPPVQAPVAAATPPAPVVQAPPAATPDVDPEEAALLAQMTALKAKKAAAAAAAAQPQVQASFPAPTGLPAGVNPMDPNLPAADFAALFPMKR